MDAGPEPEANPKGGRLAAYLKQVRDRLIQTGTRNRLVHSARFAKRGKSIDIVEERSDDVFRILLTDGKRMRFDHDPTEEEKAEGGEPLLVSSRGEERFTDSLLQTKLSQDKLQKKLLALAREAKTLEEEQGINALYLALGFLRWFEDEKSEVAREAPLVLLPVSLRRNERTSTYELEARGEDITTNEPLKHRLQGDFGIKLPDIDEGENWAPSDYFAVVQESISGHAKWEIDHNGMQLGFFSFAKLLMVRDLESENWPNESILDHPLIAGLLSEGFADEPSDFDEGVKLDEVFSPADLVQVVDADASQTLVIETVRRGRNLVVMGPPGTGKSQTITNIIASAVHDGKSVLFIAEKMAALNVVYSRLVQAGLRNVCLELHSRSANKRMVAEELGRTLGSAATHSATDDDGVELTKLRNLLNGLSDAMHQPIGEGDITPYRAISTLIRLREDGFAPVDYDIPGIENWVTDKLNDALRNASLLSEMIEKAGAKDKHPFLGVRKTDLLPTDIERLQPRLKELLSEVEKAERTTRAIAQSVGLKLKLDAAGLSVLTGVLTHLSTLSDNASKLVSRLAELGAFERARPIAQTGIALSAQSVTATSKFKPAAVAAPIDHLGAMLATGHNLLGRLGSKYKSGSSELQALILGPLPQRQPERMELLHELAEWQQLNRQFEQLSMSGSELLGEHWRGNDTDFSALNEAVEWEVSLRQFSTELKTSGAVQLRRFEQSKLLGLAEKITTDTASIKLRAQEVFDLLDLDLTEAFGASRVDEVSLDKLAHKLRLWVGNMQRLDQWSHLLNADRRFRESVGNDLANAVAQGRLQASEIVPIIRYVHAEALYRVFASQRPSMAQITADQRGKLIGSFREREKLRRSTTSQLIRGQHAANMPRGGMGAMGFIRSEIARKRGHKPIRTVMRNAGPVIQQIKPVFLMSPISVAQYLPPTVLDFDLLVIDEASQVRPEDAFGAIARAKQIVVVGDRKQLPPTSFFDRLVADEDDEDEDEEADAPGVPKVTAATELESILTLCEARGLKDRMLEWHYRSRHPSLIEVSNERFYEGRLVLFPSPATGKEADGLKVCRVDGAYDRGGKRHNVIEAEAIARAAAKHAVTNPERSLGIVTFSTAQRDQVTYWLDKLRQEDEALDIFMREGKDEEFFVKNIENVQGDERDVIFVSVGYGPRIAGQRLDSMAFGPVSSEGGERRLNVLFTRARYKTEVFVSFDSGDIDLSRTKSEGARVMKHFLQAAETGQVEQPQVLENDPDSDFEVSVARAIRSLGYEVDYQIGSGGFKIDLAVRDPDRTGRYMLAIECDGATYHSALWARERDRQRQEVLEGLDWRFHRVWSTDWFHRRDAEFRRLETAIEAAREPLHISSEPELELPDNAEEEETVLPGEPLPKDLPEYEVADFPVALDEEPHEVPFSKLSELLEKIINVEGPVHEEEVARRLAGIFGKQRAGSRIVDHVKGGLRYLKRRNQQIAASDGFWLTAEQQAQVPLRNRSRAPANLRRANLIPPIEIKEAIKRVLVENGAVPLDDVPRAVALLFGFQRTGQEFRPAVEPVLNSMMANGEASNGDVGVVLAES